MSKNDNANENSIPLLFANQARDKLVRDMLALAYTRGADRGRDAQVEAIWQKRFGVPFFPYRPTATYLRGFPGHGKTTAYHAAATEVAQMLGLTLVWEPEKPCQITEKTLLVKTVNFSGEVSNNAVAGIPLVESYEGATPAGQSADRFTRRAPPFALAAAHRAGLAIIILDDLPNAVPAIQNVANDLMDRGRAQGLDLGPRCLVGATGNLGSEDAAAVNSTSTATATRVNSYRVQDRLEDWGPRTIQMYPDAVGDAGVVAFLEAHPDMFHKPSRSKKGEPYPTPRTWSRCVEEHLRPMYATLMHPALGEQQDMRQRVMHASCDHAAGMIGTEVAELLRAHYASVLDKSLPLAQEVLRTGTLCAKSRKAFAKRYGSGVSPEETDFLRQFYTCLVDGSVPALVEAYACDDQEGFRHHFDTLLNGLYGVTQDTSHLGWVAHYLGARVIALGQDEKTFGFVDAQTNRLQVSMILLDAMTQAAKDNPAAMGAVEVGGQRRTVFDVTLLTELLGVDANASPGEMLSAAAPFNPNKSTGPAGSAPQAPAAAPTTGPAQPASAPTSTPAPPSFTL